MVPVAIAIQTIAMCYTFTRVSMTTGVIHHHNQISNSYHANVHDGSMTISSYIASALYN